MPLIRPSGTFSPRGGEKGNMSVEEGRTPSSARRAERAARRRADGGVRVSVIPSERSESRDPLRMCGARSFYSKGVPRLAALARDDTPPHPPFGHLLPARRGAGEHER